MNALLDKVERACRQHAADLGRVTALKAELARIEDKATDDFDLLVANDSKAADLRRKIGIAEKVAEGSARLVEQERAQAASRAADAKRAEIVKLSETTGVKLAKNVGRKIEELREELGKLAEIQAKVAEYNRTRGDRPYIPDPEDLAREEPGKTIPAVYRDDVVWRNHLGEPAMVFANGPDGLVPKDAGYRREAVRVLISPEERVPPRRPLRFARALKLVDWAGQPVRLAG